MLLVVGLLLGLFIGMTVVGSGDPLPPDSSWRWLSETKEEKKDD